MSGTAHPAEVEIVRGPMVESRHVVHYAVVDTAGKVVMAGGDVEAPLYPRSAVKPIQALAFVETGAAETFGLGAPHIALACGSHGGEERHTETVLAWLGRIDCTEADLDCGIHQPLNEEAARALAHAGRAPGAAHNNCSGKHTGFLSFCRASGSPLTGYTRIDHPVQQRVLGILEQMCGLDLSHTARATDGCGIPVIALPLGNLALAMARLADPSDQPDRRAHAIGRIRIAMTAEPFHVAGTDRFDTAIIEAFGGRVLVKAGAEGVSCASLPEQGLGIAVKALDGAKRAAEVVMATLLGHLAAPGPDERAILDQWSRRKRRNHAGTVVGQIRISAENAVRPPIPTDAGPQDRTPPGARSP